MNSKAFEYFFKMLRKNSPTLSYPKCFTKPVSLVNPVRFSSTPSKSIDVLDLYVDLISHKAEKPCSERVSSLTMQKKVTLNEEPQKTSKVDQIISNFNVENVSIISEMLVHQLNASLEKMNFIEINKIVQFCTDKRISLPNDLSTEIACKYSNCGFVDGLISLRMLCELTDKEEYLRNAELLHYLAYCYWICGNSAKCVEFLKKCCNKYPTFNDVTKKILKMIISQAVRSRSQAQLIIIIEFVKEFTIQFRDYYSLTVLWNELFLSEWFADQRLADELLDSNEELQKCIPLLVPSLIPDLLRVNKINDIYRFLPILLKYNNMEQYSTALQILFDHFCSLLDRSRCSEIIKSSVELKAPLREEQYKQFISWTVFGSPLKYINKTEIEKINSSF